MLSRPPTPAQTSVGGRSPAAETPPPNLPLADADEAPAGGGLSPPPPPPPTAPCCSCASLLPRLLAAHRMEVRRLLRGALASLSRRLDSLERRSGRNQRRRKKQNQRAEAGSPAVIGSSASSTPAPQSHIITPSYSSFTSLSDLDDPPPSCSSSQSEQSRKTGEEEEEKTRKRRSIRGFSLPGDGGEEEEDPPLFLQDFNHRKRRRREGEASQSEKALSVVVRKNGYSSSSSQHAVLPLQSAVIGQACSQSEALSVSGETWIFSDIITHLSHSPTRLHPWLQKSTLHVNPTLMLHLSAVAMETVLDWVRGGASWSPLRPLRDWTAPPSVSSDHCYIRRQTTSPTGSVPVHLKLRPNHSSWIPRLPRRRGSPLPLCSANGLSAALPADQSAALSEFESSSMKLSKRVSQIRIRRASPRETPLTPMGLPKVKRLKKKEFSLEEIYTNKNYEAPPTIRSLETIFEEPREKDGALFLIGQQKRRRLLLFPDFTQPRKRKKPQGVGLPLSLVPRKRAAMRRHLHGGGLDDGGDLDVMLVERLSELDDFLTRQGLDV